MSSTGATSTSAAGGGAPICPSPPGVGEAPGHEPGIPAQFLRADDDRRDNHASGDEEDTALWPLPRSELVGHGGKERDLGGDP
jgi:hypothetical protein